MLVLGSVNSSDMQKVVSALITWANFHLYACRRGSSDFFLAEQAVHNCHTCVFGMRIKQKWSTLSGLDKQTSAPLQNAGCTMEPINLSLDCTLRKSVKYTCFLCYFRSKPKTRLLQNYMFFACLLRFVKRCSARKNWFKWGKNVKMRSCLQSIFCYPVINFPQEVLLSTTEIKHSLPERISQRFKLNTIYKK